MGETSTHSLSSAGNHFHANYKFMIERGAQNTSQWLVTGQLFVRDASGWGGTPPFEIKFMGNDKMGVVIKSGSASSPVERTIYLDTTNIQRGKGYDMQIDVKFDPAGNNGGHAYVWRDGVKIANYNGKIGYNEQTQMHWRWAPTRKTPAGGESFAINYKDIDLTYGANGHSDSAGTPAPTPTPTPSPTTEIKGTSASETIYGYDGNDKLNGKGGNDVLVGGAGRDAFVFDSSPKSNVDRISDFVPGTDKIHVDNAVFAGGNVDWGSLQSHMFKIGAKATDTSDRFIYNKDTGSLYFDQDGTGSAAQVQFAKLATNLKMTAADFYIL